MAKSLCKLRKTIKTDFKKYVQRIDAPTHVCEKCGRAANSRNYLCSPTKMK